MHSRSYSEILKHKIKLCYIKLQLPWNREHDASFVMTKWLSVFREITALFSDNSIEHISRLCKQNQEFLGDKEGFNCPVSCALLLDIHSWCTDGASRKYLYWHCNEQQVVGFAGWVYCWTSFTGPVVKTVTTQGNSRLMFPEVWQ